LKKYRDLLENSGQMKSELDYLQFQFRQLDEARLKEGEQEELELELEKLTHAGEIKNSLSALDSLLEGENLSALQQLKECTGHINRIHKYLPDGESLLHRLDAAYIDLKDMAHDIRVLNDQLDPDPSRLTQVNAGEPLCSRKNTGYPPFDLVALHEQLHARIDMIQSVDFSLEEYEKELEARLNGLALELRHWATGPSALEQKITDRSMKSESPMQILSKQNP
jgi:DNA repair protein RecN (Recombination protein N)